LEELNFGGDEAEANSALPPGLTRVVPNWQRGPPALENSLEIHGHAFRGPQGKVIVVLRKRPTIPTNHGRDNSLSSKIRACTAQTILAGAPVWQSDDDVPPTVSPFRHSGRLFLLFAQSRSSSCTSTRRNGSTSVTSPTV